jgi:hypothetical protein
MVTVETRPLDDSEREALSRLISGAETRERREPLLAGGLTFIVGGGVALLAWPWDRGLPSLVPIAIALIAGFLVFRRMRDYQARSKATTTLSADLAEGQAQVTTYEAVDAILVEELDDEGSQYFLELRDGRILFVAGQYLYECEDDARFPNTRFQAVRTARSGHLLAFNCLGAYLPPSSRLRPFSDADYRASRVPVDGAVWEGDFEALRDTDAP